MKKKIIIWAVIIILVIVGVVLVVIKSDVLADTMAPNTAGLPSDYSKRPIQISTGNGNQLIYPSTNPSLPGIVVGPGGGMTTNPWPGITLDPNPTPPTGMEQMKLCLQEWKYVQEELNAQALARESALKSDFDKALDTATNNAVVKYEEWLKQKQNNPYGQVMSEEEIVKQFFSSEASSLYNQVIDKHNKQQSSTDLPSWNGTCPQPAAFEGSSGGIKIEKMISIKGVGLKASAYLGPVKISISEGIRPGIFGLGSKKQRCRSESNTTNLSVSYQNPDSGISGGGYTDFAGEYRLGVGYCEKF